MIEDVHHHNHTFYIDESINQEYGDQAAIFNGKNPTFTETNDGATDKRA